MTSSSNSQSDRTPRSAELPTSTEIEQTFAALGLASNGPTGYQYFSNASPQTKAVFEVTRSTTTSPRVS